MIYDATHQSVAVHKALSSYILTDAADLDLEKVSRYSSDEEAFRQLWLTFFDHIAIESRKNPGLQMQLIPEALLGRHPGIFPLLLIRADTYRTPNTRQAFSQVVCSTSCTETPLISAILAAT